MCTRFWPIWTQLEHLDSDLSIVKNDGQAHFNHTESKHSHLVAGNLTHNVSLNLPDTVESLVSASPPSAHEPANQKSWVNCLILSFYLWDNTLTFAKSQRLQGNETSDLGGGEGQGPDSDGDGGIKLGHRDQHQQAQTW